MCIHAWGTKIWTTEDPFLNFPHELSHHLSGSLSESPFRMQWKVIFFPTSATRLAAEIAKLLPGSIPLEQTPRYTFSTGSPAWLLHWTLLDRPHMIFHAIAWIVGSSSTKPWSFKKKSHRLRKISVQSIVPVKAWWWFFFENGSFIDLRQLHQDDTII